VCGIAAIAIAASSLVAAAMALCLEAQAAIGMEATGEGSLVGVHSHVRLQVAPIARHFQANVTLKVGRVGLKAVRKKDQIKRDCGQDKC
jgi:hypothetical protein